MKKQIAALLTAGLLALTLAGCGSGAESYYAASAAAAPYEKDSFAAGEYGYDEESAMGGANTLDQLAPSNRKIIYTANLHVETKDFPASYQALSQAVSAAKGYLQNSSEYGSADSGDRNARLTFRIPAENYRSFLDAVGTVGSVTSRSENTEDITANYVDVEARIESLEAQKARLEALREQASNLEDLLTIENQLTQVQYQLESYQGQRKLYDNQVSYCTVDISLSEVTLYTPTSVSFSNRVLSAVEDSFDGFVSFLQNWVLFLIYALPYLLLVGAVAVIILLVSRRLRHREKPASPAPLKPNLPPPPSNLPKR